MPFCIEGCSRKKLGGGMENHSYFHEDISFSCEAVPGAVCLLRADASEKIVEFNKELLNLYQCGSREEFLQFTHGTFRGMVLASAYCPLTAMDTLWEKREEEGPLYLDFDIRTKQGHLRHIDAYLCRLERRGQAYWSMYHRVHGQETRHPYCFGDEEYRRPAAPSGGAAGRSPAEQARRIHLHRRPHRL